MIDKQDFYHGAVLAQIVSCRSVHKIVKRGSGYVVNDQVFVGIKYTTKNKSPWRYTFTAEEIIEIVTSTNDFKGAHFAFVCGGDGICVLNREELKVLLGDLNGWLSIGRSFRKQYEVKGSMTSLSYKISFKRLTEIFNV